MTTRPPLSPVASNSPVLLNSTQEMMSAETRTLASWMNARYKKWTTDQKAFTTHHTMWHARIGPNGSCLFTAGSPTDIVDSQNFRILSTHQIALLVPERPMSSRLLRLLLQCAGIIKMNPGPDTTLTHTNCLRLMQWNASWICGKITELVTFLHSNNVNIAAVQETKLTNKTKPLKTPGLAAVRLDRHKNKGGSLLMLIKDTIPFVDNTAALPQSADPHLKQQGILITMPHSSCSAGHNDCEPHQQQQNVAYCCGY